MLLPLPLPWTSPPQPDHQTTVVIPLSEAHKHSHAYRLRARSQAEGQLDGDAFDDDGGIDKDGDGGGEDGGVTAVLMMGSAPEEYSIEGLRNEVRRGGGEGASGYESEFLLSTLISCLFGAGGFGEFGGW